MLFVGRACTERVTAQTHPCDFKHLADSNLRRKKRHTAIHLGKVLKLVSYGRFGRGRPLADRERLFQDSPGVTRMLGRRHVSVMPAPGIEHPRVSALMRRSAENPLPGSRFPGNPNVQTNDRLRTGMNSGETDGPVAGGAMVESPGPLRWRRRGSRIESAMGFRSPATASRSAARREVSTFRGPSRRAVRPDRASFPVRDPIPACSSDGTCSRCRAIRHARSFRCYPIE